MQKTVTAALAVLSLWAGTLAQAESVRLMVMECRPRFEKTSPQFLDIDQPVEPQTPAKINPKEHDTHLILEADMGKVEILWSWTRAGETHFLYPKLNLELEKSCIFTVEEVTMTLKELDPELRPEMGEKTIRQHELVKVAFGEKVLFDRSICEVHGVAMERRRAPVSYGFPDIDYPFDVFHHSFPNSREVVLGGCIPGHKKTDHLFVCPACVEAYAKWKQKKPKASP
jgi:hypothetical protein